MKHKKEIKRLKKELNTVRLEVQYLFAHMKDGQFVKNEDKEETVYNIKQSVYDGNMIGGINSTITHPPRYANETVTEFNDRMKVRVEEIKDEGLE